MFDSILIMKKFYISFGQKHVHGINGKLFNKDCIAVIEARSIHGAQALAMWRFDQKFANVYSELPDMTYYPRGLISLE